jgi:proteasome alpha subunit
LLEGGKDVPEKELGDVDAAPPAPAAEKPVVSAAPENLEGVADDGDETGDAVNGDNS